MKTSQNAPYIAIKRSNLPQIIPDKILIMTKKNPDQNAERLYSTDDYDQNLNAEFESFINGENSW